MKRRKRLAILIGVAAVGVIALGAQTVMAGRAGPGSHDTVRTVVPWHGGLGSEVRKCVEGRRVFLFEQRRGPDRQLGSDRNLKVDPDADPADPGWFTWLVEAPRGGRVYAKVMPKVRDGFVCRADRSRTIVNGCVGQPGCGKRRVAGIGTPGRKQTSPSAQTAAEPPAVVKYDSTLTITRN